MDFDEIFEMFGIEPEGEDEAPEPPSFRATIRGSRLMVVAWMPHLLTSGPTGRLVRDRAEDGVTVADLWVTDDEPSEVIVEYLAVADRGRADRLLSRWAEAVGHGRLWLPDRLVTLDPDRPLGSAKVECPTCGAGWQDSGADFWENVRNCGRFPALCPICNADLPQWQWRPGRRSRRAPQRKA
ncbi:MAG: hypothetical protein FJW90_12665 [Actinobacteria bacterium]|nr:hypothetical protein [Actinomycetota bacterium]